MGMDGWNHVPIRFCGYVPMLGCILSVIVSSGVQHPPSLLYLSLWGCRLVATDF